MGHRKINKNRKQKLPRLLFLSDDIRVKNPIKTIKTLPRGCGVIIRDYKNPKRQELIDKARSITKTAGRVFFVANFGWGAIGANEHWPQAGRALHRKKHRHQLITTSAHNISEVGRANRLNPDAILLSPLFKTKSHKDATTLDIHKFVRLSRLAKPEVYALGGINKKNIKRIYKKMPVYGVAGISLFLNK